MESSLVEQHQEFDDERYDGYIPPDKEKPVYEWTEITGEFFESIQELQLVFLRNFSDILILI